MSTTTRPASTLRTGPLVRAEAERLVNEFRAAVGWTLSAHGADEILERTRRADAIRDRAKVRDGEAGRLGHLMLLEQCSTSDVVHNARRGRALVGGPEGYLRDLDAHRADRAAVDAYVAELPER